MYIPMATVESRRIFVRLIQADKQPIPTVKPLI